MELRESHLRYLLVIYELGQVTMDVGTADIAKVLDCSKASVTNMIAYVGLKVHTDRTPWCIADVRTPF